MATKIFSVLKAAALFLPLFFGLSVAYSWDTPTLTPPDGNTSTKINISVDDQTKLGDLCTTKGSLSRCLSIIGLPLGTTMGQDVRWDGTRWGISNEGDLYVNGVAVGHGGGNVSSNTVGGNFALADNTTGSSNTAYGSYALNSNTTGSYNTVYGISALVNGTTGSSNTASGISALQNHITGSSNTANGALALINSTTGHSNSTIGKTGLGAITTGSYNTSNGYLSAGFNDTGNYNTAFGVVALGSRGGNNTAIGSNALWWSGAGSNNTVIGAGALTHPESGNYNTAVGAQTFYITGLPMPDWFISGSYNTALGYRASISIGNLTNATAIGNGAIADASNKVRIGNAAVTVIGGPVAWSNLSDIRAKEDIVDYTHGLDLITKLRPVEYKLKADSTKKVHSGFIAQEVEATGIPFYGLNKPESKEGYYSLSYDEVVIPLVNSARELKAENDKINAENDILRARLEKLEAKVNSL